ncbi:hypothetical protein JKP88DRAFT_274529 [Tribonema minus]|uniref:RGS domain-containing protein n=1 Tax=Tribonema minus TaxID=303371 RepID=A0A836C7L3_9STRA|nr:hypothetical protein JKP88DRAFT_274529 [Tribonema minus]
MEELQDAIEDAQYLSAVISKGGPKPTEKWVFPSAAELEQFKASQLARNPNCFSLDNICRQILGFYLFRESCKSQGPYFREFCKSQGPYVNAKVAFVTDVVRFKRLRSHAKRRRFARRIIEAYLLPAPDAAASVLSGQPATGLSRSGRAPAAAAAAAAAEGVAAGGAGGEGAAGGAHSHHHRHHHRRHRDGEEDGTAAAPDHTGGASVDHTTHNDAMSSIKTVRPYHRHHQRPTNEAAELGGSARSASLRIGGSGGGGNEVDLCRRPPALEARLRRRNEVDLCRRPPALEAVRRMSSFEAVPEPSSAPVSEAPSPSRAERSRTSIIALLSPSRGSGGSLRGSNQGVTEGGRLVFAPRVNAVLMGSGGSLRSSNRGMTEAAASAAAAAATSSSPTATAGGSNSPSKRSSTQGRTSRSGTSLGSKERQTGDTLGSPQFSHHSKQTVQTNALLVRGPGVDDMVAALPALAEPPPPPPEPARISMIDKASLAKLRFAVAGGGSMSSGIGGVGISGGGGDASAPATAACTPLPAAQRTPAAREDAAATAPAAAASPRKRPSNGAIAPLIIPDLALTPAAAAAAPTNADSSLRSPHSGGGGGGSGDSATFKSVRMAEGAGGGRGPPPGPPAWPPALRRRA